MSEWVHVGSMAELTEDMPISAQVGGAEVGVFLVNGNVHAIEDVCPHAYALLSQGFVEGETVECVLHGAMFHIPTGRCLKEPAGRDLKVYAVKVKDGEIFVRPS